MTDHETWQQNNDRKLAAMLADLRQRLERFVHETPSGSSAPTSAVPASASKRSMFRLPGMKGAPAELTRLAPPPAEHRPETGSEQKAAVDLPSALELLSDRLGLSSFEQNVLMLCAGMELDTRIAGLCARAHDDPQRPYPTFALALALFEQPSWDVLSPDRPLRYWRLLEINQPGDRPLTASPLRADERIVSYLKGLNYLDDRVSPFLAPVTVDPEPPDLAPSQTECVKTILLRWQEITAQAPLPVVQLVGSDPVSKQLVSRVAAARLNRQLYRLPVELLPGAPADLETLARLWQRESRLLPLALYLDAEDVDAAAVGRAGPLSRFLARNSTVIFVGIREALPRLGKNDLTLDVGKPTVSEQQTAWTDVLRGEAPGTPALLASQFSLNLPGIRSLTRLARTEAGAAPEALAGKLWDICRASERPRLDTLAQRLEPKMTWDDLVLPPQELNLLKQIAAQVALRNTVYNEWGFSRKMNRGFGINALFAGDSGTGKTMAAEVIANSLRLNLYRIDLSSVVNKYIGETEKNLRRLFDAAEDAGVILFFDEADALFGKRSEIRDSHDRYANIEINYLLQRIESYRGLAILATNMKDALDPAFLRRLRFIVNFPFPGTVDRRRLWERVFLQTDAVGGSPAPPLGELDYDRLARLNLTGGYIHNVALNAAFMAAHEGSKVTMALILKAARAEFLKLDRPLNEADFRWMEPSRAARTSEPSPELSPEPAFS